MPFLGVPRCRLADCGLGPAGVASLASSLHTAAGWLRTLDLAGNAAGRRGGLALAAAASQPTSALAALAFDYNLSQPAPPTAVDTAVDRLSQPRTQLSIGHDMVMGHEPGGSDSVEWSRSGFEAVRDTAFPLLFSLPFSAFHCLSAPFIVCVSQVVAGFCEALPHTALRYLDIGHHPATGRDWAHHQAAAAPGRRAALYLKGTDGLPTKASSLLAAAAAAARRPALASAAMGQAMARCRLERVAAAGLSLPHGGGGGGSPVQAARDQVVREAAAEAAAEVAAAAAEERRAGLAREYRAGVELFGELRAQAAKDWQGKALPFLDFPLPFLCLSLIFHCLSLTFH